MHRKSLTQQLVNVAVLTTLACFVGPVALAQTSTPTTEELDAVKDRLIEHYNMREGPVAMRDLPEWAPIRWSGAAGTTGGGRCPAELTTCGWKRSDRSIRAR